jgi:hypothetical protein
MRLLPHRRNLVVWTQSAGPDGRFDIPPFRRNRRTGRARASLRVAALLPVVGLMQLGRVLQARWRALLAGAALTVAGVILRGGAGGMVLLPGLMFLLYSPFIPADLRPRELKREMAAYSTPTERRDLEATLDRYPDRLTGELRDILHNLAVATDSNRLPGARAR